MNDSVNRQTVTGMKLIDVSVLKEWVENWFTKNRLYHPYAKNNNIPITELYDILELIPSVDAVVVVRCKDCTHSEHWYWDKSRCFLWCETGIGVFEDGYCSYGEPKEIIKDLSTAEICEEWVSVKKDTPKTPVRVQVQLDNGWIITAYYDDEKWYAVPDWDEPLEGVLAWRPLPEPWKGEQDG